MQLFFRSGTFVQCNLILYHNISLFSWLSCRSTPFDLILQLSENLSHANSSITSIHRQICIYFSTVSFHSDLRYCHLKLHIGRHHPSTLNQLRPWKQWSVYQAKFLRKYSCGRTSKGIIHTLSTESNCACFSYVKGGTISS